MSIYSVLGAKGGKVYSILGFRLPTTCGHKKFFCSSFEVFWQSMSIYSDLGAKGAKGSEGDEEEQREWRGAKHILY